MMFQACLGLASLDCRGSTWATETCRGSLCLCSDDLTVLLEVLSPKVVSLELLQECPLSCTSIISGMLSCVHV